MIQICRAEDGQVFQLNVSLWDIEKLGSLEHFLQEETGVEQDCILAYLSDGRRLRNENVRDLAGVQDQTIFVYNKAYLDNALDQVLQRLRIEPPLQPPVEETISATPPLRPSQLASSYLRASHLHLEQVNGTLRSLRYQHEALRIASSALDLHVLAISDAFEGISAGAKRELEKQEALLAGLDADLEIVGRVTVHKEFVSPNVRKAMELGDKGRTLGDYVSHVKMRQVAETCMRTHEDLQERFRQARSTMARLSEGADDVRTVVSDSSPLDDAEMCCRRSQEILDKIVEHAAVFERPLPESEKTLQEIRHLDSTLRGELQHITQTKNSYTERCISVLRQISILNNDVVQLPPTLTSLQASFRAKTSFSHIQRLHNMLYAYGATVVEIVRRKEFAQFFYQRAQSILEVMAKLSANERKRRQVYRGEVYGQLPFETRGMDEPVPVIDFSPTGPVDSPYSLERSDVDGLMRILDDLQHFAQNMPDSAAVASVQEARTSLEKLISKMDSLESGFDRIAERSLLSSSRLLTHRRRSTEDDQIVFAELEMQIANLDRAKAEQETSFQRDRRALEEEASHLRGLVQDADATRDQLERELHATKAQLSSEVASRRILEQHNGELTSENNTLRQSLATALAEATEQTKSAEILRQELAQVRAEVEEVKALEARNAAGVTSLLEEQSNALQRLEEARARGENLETQIRTARRESDEVKRALSEASKEKDRLLRAQASEHDRIMRDHIAEADGDRAVLEHQYLELKAALEDAERQLKHSQAHADMAGSDVVGLREELQRLEHELREARHVERILRDDLRAGRASQSDFELKLEHSSRLVAQILDVALAFRESHVKALAAAMTMVSHPSSSKTAANLSLNDSALGGVRRGVVPHLAEPSPIDPSDPSAALEALRSFDHDQFLEAVNKTGSTIRKWQKQCKEYRERAKGKISFRNFAKGDLALFLPTRNSVSKPWAAFNVSFPHYFLQATGHLGEQLKTREWIVARITSITERVVDHKDINTNPYGLGDGVKYYMLEVEDWTQPTHSPRRRLPAKKALSDVSAPSATPGPPPAPPDLSVEESFVTARPPISRLFPQRSRSNSSPTAGPSSLSRLLAQAGSSERPAPETAVTSESETPSPVHSPPPPISPIHTASNPPSGGHGVNGTGSGRRPGSRASRISSSSRFSAGRIPFAGSTGPAKATATTALSEHPTSTSPSARGSFSSPLVNSISPSPEGSPTEGMSNILNRRRTTSYQIPRNPPGTLNLTGAGMNGAVSDPNHAATSARSRLASLASSWGVPFGRRKAISPAMASPVEAFDGHAISEDVQDQSE